MKLAVRLPQYVRNNRRHFALITVGIIALAAVILWTTRADEPRGQVRPRALTGSDDMAGMDMSGDGSVQLSEAQLREFGITFASAEMRGLSGELRTVGSVVVDETRVAAVTMKVSGFIERLHVDFTGHPVQRGQALFDVYSPDILATQEELLLANRLQGALQSDVPGVPRRPVDLQAAARQRLRLWDVSEAQIDQILGSGTARRTVTISSPASGFVVEKNVVAGQAVQPGDLLYRIADLSRVWIEAQIREADAEAISTGARVTIESPAYPGRLLNGTIQFVYPVLDSATRSLRARVEAANPAGILRPGTYVTVRVFVPGRLALTVPATAIVNTGERSVVFVDYGGGKIRPQRVMVGRVTDEWAEIISGVEPGQRVVTSAQFLLDSESNLAEVMRGMMSQGASGMESMDMGDMNNRGADMRGMKMPPAKR